MNWFFAVPLWIITTIVIGVTTGGLIAVYAPVWVLILITLVMLLLGLISMFDYGYFGSSWLFSLMVMVFNIPMWISGLIVYTYLVTRTLQVFP